MRARHSMTAGLVAGALVATACGGSGDGAGAITTSQEAFAAITDSIDGPIRTRTVIDAEFDLAELGSLAETHGLDDPSSDGEFGEFMDVADQLADHAVMTARGDNRTWSFALEYLGTNWVEFAVDASDAPAADAYPLDDDGNFDWSAIEPFELGFYGRVDLPTAIAVVESFDPGSTETAEEDIEGARQDAVRELEGSFPDLIPIVEAAFASRWVGIDGELDLATIFEMIGAVDPAMLGATSPANQPSAADLMDLLEAAVTLRDFRVVDGGDVATADLHPRAGIEAFLDFMEEYDTSGMVAEMYRSDEMLGDLSDVPETLPGVASVRFVDGLLVEVRVHGLAIAAAAIAYDTAADDDKARTADALAEVTSSRFDVVTTLSDHDDVGDVANVDATTISWGTLMQLAGMAMMGGGFT